MTEHFDAVFFDDDTIFNGAAINRILEKVAETPQGKKLAQRCPRDKLAERLVAARAQWRVFSTAHRQRVEGVDRRLAKMFRRLAKSAQRFKKEFDALTTRPQLEGFLGTLERVISVAEASAQTYEYRIKGRSLKESFVNGMLAPIFEDCFGLKAGGPGEKSGRRAQDIQHGLFARFVVAVEEEMKVGLSVNVTKRALQPPRRKHNQPKRPRER